MVGFVGRGGVESVAGVGTSSGSVLPASFDLASDPESFHSPDLADFEFVLSVVEV